MGTPLLVLVLLSFGLFCTIFAEIIEPQSSARTSPSPSQFSPPPPPPPPVPRSPPSPPPPRATLNSSSRPPSPAATRHSPPPPTSTTLRGSHSPTQPPPSKRGKNKTNIHISPPPPFPRPPPGHPLDRRLNTGKKIGLLFIGIIIVMQIGVVGFLVFKRRQLLKVKGEYGPFSS